MLEAVLQYLKSFFVREIYRDHFRVRDGALVLDCLLPGQYFRIYGSTLNDGVYQYPAASLRDEEFDGAVMALAIPPPLLELVEEIQAWQSENGDAGPYTSESFGGYSYSRATNARGAAIGWQDAFASRLEPYKKLSGAYPFAEPNPRMTPPLPRPSNPWR